jgi:hypothetical protein
VAGRRAGAAVSWAATGEARRLRRAVPACARPPGVDRGALRPHVRLRPRAQERPHERARQSETRRREPAPGSAGACRGPNQARSPHLSAPLPVPSGPVPDTAGGSRWPR